MGENISIVAIEKCCGCTACSDICPVGAISMQTDARGFFHPVIEQSICLHCGRCINVCQAVEPIQENERFGKRLYAMHCDDLTEQRTSKSGGVFAIMADNILVSGGIVYGVIIDEEFVVKHQRIDKIENREALKGTKYVQSDIRGIYPQIERDLVDGYVVLFSGTPCQVVGLKKYLEEKKIDIDKLICCDIVCHGVPSKLLFDAYINYMEKKQKKKISRFVFRGKNPFGWGDEREIIEFTDGTTINSSKYYNVDYFMMVYRHELIRRSCFSCQYCNLNRCGDITLGDCWGLQNTRPELVDLNGVSLCIVNTIKGQKLFFEICSKCKSANITEQDCMQPNLYHPSMIKEDTEICWEEFLTKGIKNLIRKDMPSFLQKIRIFCRK